MAKRHAPAFYPRNEGRASQAAAPLLPTSNRLYEEEMQNKAEYVGETDGEKSIVTAASSEETSHISRGCWVFLIVLLLLILSGWAIGATGFGLSLGLPITYKNDLQDQINTIDDTINNIESQIVIIDNSISELVNSTDVITECITVTEETVELCKSLVVPGNITTPDTVVTENIVVGTPSKRRAARTVQCAEPTG